MFVLLHPSYNDRKNLTTSPFSSFPQSTSFPLLYYPHIRRIFITHLCYLQQYRYSTHQQKSSIYNAYLLLFIISNLKSPCLVYDSSLPLFFSISSNYYSTSSQDGARLASKHSWRSWTTLLLHIPWLSTTLLLPLTSIIFIWSILLNLLYSVLLLNNSNRSSNPLTTNSHFINNYLFCIYRLYYFK